MKTAAAFLGLALMAAPAAAEPQIIPTLINHIDTTEGRVTSAVLNRGGLAKTDPLSLSINVADEQSCALLAFNAAMAEGRATVTCLKNGRAVKTYLYERKTGAAAPEGGWLRF